MSGWRGLGACDERGSILLLGLGLVVGCLLAVTVLVDASAAFLQRQRLLTLADGAALAGAQAIDLAAYYDQGASSRTTLDPAAVGAVVRQYVQDSGSVHAIDGLTIERVWSDGEQVLVRLQAPIVLPLLPDLFPGDISVESVAQLAYREYRETP